MFQNTGNLYECVDSGFDVTRMGSILGSLEYLRSTQPKSAAVVALSKANVVQKADLLPLVRAASSTDRALVERYIEGSADFDQVVMGAYNDNSFLTRWDDTEARVGFTYMLMVRNFASTLFLMGNPTVVPHPKSLMESKQTVALDRLMLRNYLSDVSTLVSDEKLLEQARTTVTIGRKNELFHE
jgi:hypothetical protein